MRIAILSDIHGNMVALETVLSELAAEQIDGYVYLGDVSLGGPQPRQALERVQALGATFVRGNSDDELLALRPDLPEWLDDMFRWNRAQIDDAQAGYLAALPLTARLTLAPDIDLLAYHGSPRSNTEYVRTDTPEEELRPMFEPHLARVLVGGHTHVQMYRRFDDALLINPGSIGMARQAKGRPGLCVPWAEYAVVDVHAGRTHVDLRRVQFDLDRFVWETLQSGMPHAARWLAHYWAVQ